MGGLVNEVGTLLGGGPNNSSYQAQGTDLMKTTSPQALANAQSAMNSGLVQSQGGLDQQQNFVNALMNQNGIGNQNALAGMLAQRAAGGGPNPAAQALANATGQNVAQTAALMAGQRGAGSNAGLIARQAGQQGANLQQQAVGQSALQQAQQQIAAQNQLGQLAANQVAQQQGGLGQLMGGQQAQNNALQNQQNSLLNAAGQLNNANVSMQSNINNANSGMAQTNANNSEKIIEKAGGGLFNSASALPMLMASGGVVADMGSKSLPSHLESIRSIYHPETSFAHGGKVDLRAEGGKISGKAPYLGDSIKNDTVPALLSSGEIVLPRSVTQSKDPVDAAAKFVAAIQKKKGTHEKAHKDFKGALSRALRSRT